MTWAVSSSDIAWRKTMAQDIADWDGVGRNQPLYKRDARFFLIVGHMLVWKRHMLDSNGTGISPLCMPRLIAIPHHLIDISVAIYDVVRRYL